VCCKCVAVCCNVLQLVVLQCVVVCCIVDWSKDLVCLTLLPQILLQAPVRCSVLQCVAICCSVLQCVAVCCSVLKCVAAWHTSQRVAVCCSVLQCVVVCCSMAHLTVIGEAHIGFTSEHAFGSHKQTSYTITHPPSPPYVFVLLGMPYVLPRPKRCALRVSAHRPFIQVGQPC